MRTLIMLLLVLSSAPLALGQSYPQWGDLASGPFKVGFRVEQVYDYSRTFRAPIGFNGAQAAEPVYRPVQIGIWYPVPDDVTGPALPYKEYLYLWRTEQAFGPVSAAEKEATLREFQGRSAWRQYLGTPLAESEWQTILDTPTAAIHDAKPASGPFPLVLYINATYFHNVDIEYLVSHGYVVASVRNVGIDPALTRFCCNDPQDVEAYVEDLAFVHAYMRAFDFVDPEQVAFAGPTASTAGIGLQMRNVNLKAIVAWEYETAPSVQALPFYDVAKVRIPILAMNSGERKEGQNGLSSYRYADRYAIQFEDLRHADVYALFHKFSPERIAEQHRPARLVSGYDAMTRYTRRFLDAYMKRDEGAQAWLYQFAQESAPNQTRFRWPAEPAPPLEYEFTALLEQDVAEAESLYWAVALRDPSYRPFVDHRLRRIGRQHVRAGRLEEAIAIYKMIAHSYPDAPEAQRDLGLAYAAAQHSEEAKQHLYRAWALDPTNQALQDRYVQVAASGPPGRNQPTFTYDATRKQGVLFGGFGDEGALMDTWIWDGKQWVQKAISGPSARGSHAATFDAKREQVVLFGGVHSGTRLGDTWLWDGTTWSQASVDGPPARSSHQVVYDAARGQVVLFGGNSDAGLLGDTWLWDGTTWMERAVRGPSPRKQHQMVYDMARQRVVLFGGSDSTGYRGDTWSWDGEQWSRVTEAGPPARDHHGIAYDAASQAVVLFGGWNGGYLGDTWQLRDEIWNSVAMNGPSPRGGKPAMLTWEDGSIVLYGGGNAQGWLRDLWRWRGGQWSRVEPILP